MRVEQLIGNYSRLRDRQQGKKRSLPPHAASYGMQRGAVMDMVCLSADDFEQDLDWFDAYVRQLPDEVVIERIRQIFHASLAFRRFPY